METLIQTISLSNNLPTDNRASGIVISEWLRFRSKECSKWYLQDTCFVILPYNFQWSPISFHIKLDLLNLAVTTFCHLTSNYLSHFISQFLFIDPLLSWNSPSASVIAQTICPAWHAFLFLFLSKSLSTFRTSLRYSSSVELSFTISDLSDLDILLHTAVIVPAACNHKCLFIPVFSLQGHCHTLSTLAYR